MGDVLAIVRSAMGISQLDMATLLGWSQSTVARVESGERGTLYDIRELLAFADVLGIPREALVPVLVDGSSDDAEEGAEGDRMALSRRALGGLISGTIAAATFGTAGSKFGSRVEPAHLNFFTSVIEKIYELDQQGGGGGRLAEFSLNQYRRARHLLDNADYGDAVGCRLTTIVGELAVFTGWLYFDADIQDKARQLYLDALFIAEQSGDGNLATRTVDKLSMQSAHLAIQGSQNRAREAVRLARRATGLARREQSPRLHALLATREAVAYAACGRSDEVVSAARMAWMQVDRGLEVGGQAPWLKFVNAAEIDVCLAKAFSLVGDHATAVRLCLTARDTEMAAARNRVNYQANLSACLANSGDVQGALSEGLVVLPLLEESVTSARTVSRLRPLRLALANDGSAEEFCARYDSLLAGVGGT